MAIYIPSLGINQGKYIAVSRHDYRGKKKNPLNSRTHLPLVDSAMRLTCWVVHIFVRVDYWGPCFCLIRLGVVTCSHSLYLC